MNVLSTLQFFVELHELTCALGVGQHRQEGALGFSFIFFFVELRELICALGVGQDHNALGVCVDV